MTASGNPRPDQAPILRGQLERRDAHIDRLTEEIRVLRKVRDAAAARHEAECDCEGEACAVGEALVQWRAIHNRLEGARRLHQGSIMPRRMR